MKIALFILSRFSLGKVLATGLMVFFISGASLTLAQVTSNFQQEITAGTLSVDIVDGSYDPVPSPSVEMQTTAFSFSCQTVNGVFGTSSQQIYIQNPSAANDGFTVSLAASNATDLWDSAGTPFDFNDPNAAGCTDGGDADSYGGQMTVNPSVADLDEGNCLSCDLTGLTLGSSASFSQGVTDSITIITAGSGSNDIGDWTIQDIAIAQTIPAEQPAASDYNIDMVLSIVAS